MGSGTWFLPALHDDPHGSSLKEKNHDRFFA
jgi:hypothetical protein